MSPKTRSSCVVWVVVACASACGGDGGAPDAGLDATMSRVDAAGLDAPGLDAAEDDAFTPGLDAPGLDAPGLDTPGLDAFAEGCAHPPAAFDEGLSPTCTLHVAVGGTGDGSEAAPFGDLEVAVRAATPGTEIRVHAGTHPAATTWRTCTAPPPRRTGSAAKKARSSTRRAPARCCT